jgi:cytoskeletal protein RodZ
MKASSWVTIGVLVVITFFSAIWWPVKAQSPKALQNIRTSIIQAIGAQEPAVDLKIAGGILMISRVNSTLNQANHTARDGEASRIATLVAGTIVGKTEFNKIHTIRVQYVGRIKTGSHEKIIDTVDFRRDPNGVFHFHTT